MVKGSKRIRGGDAIPFAVDPALDAEEYNKVVDAARLLTIQVSKVRVDVAPAYFDPKSSHILLVKRTELGAVFDSEQRGVLARFLFEVAARQARKKVLSASAEYIVAYKLEEDVQPAAAIAFCNRVGIFACYPYFRALLAHLSWAANAQLPPLPVIATRGSPIRAAAPAKPKKDKGNNV